MSFSWWPPDGPFPNTPGGIRGPDARTLTDLYNQAATANAALAAIAASLSAMALDTVQIRDDLRRLAGDPAATPANWTGLPPNWIQTIGPPIATAIDTMRPNLARIYTNTLQTNQSLIFAGMPITAGGRVSQAVDMVISEAPNRSTARFAIEALAAAVGSLGSDPASETVKTLLADILAETTRGADCCEENGGGGDDPGGPLNSPPPAAFCEDNISADRVRVATLIPIDSGAVGGAVGQTRIGLDFGSPADGILTYDATASAEANLPVYLVTYGSTLEGCMDWDMTGNSNPPWTVEHILVEDVAGTWTGTISTTIGNTSGTQPGGGAWSRANGLRFAFRLVYTDAEDAQAPNRNFWLSYGNEPA
jgi:hypothetical protein